MSAEMEFPELLSQLRAMDHEKFARYALRLLQEVVEEVGPHPAKEADLIEYFTTHRAPEALE